MRGSNFEEIYCEVCGTHLGLKSGRGAVLGIRCTDPICKITTQANPQDSRNAMIAGLMIDRVPAPTVAVAFGTSRQRVYQILNGWKLGV